MLGGVAGPKGRALIRFSQGGKQGAVQFLRAARWRDWRIWRRNFDAVWDDPRKREALLTLLTRIEEIEEVNGASGHHVTVGRNP